MELHCPPPSEPLPDSWRPNLGMSSRLPKCPFCHHDWHGLPCRRGSGCRCNTSNELLHKEDEPDAYGRDDPGDQHLPMVWGSDV